MATSSFCEGKGKPEIIQFVPKNHTIEVILCGSGKAVVDFGDGKKSKKRLSSSSITFRHSTGASNRIITITGKNIALIHINFEPEQEQKTVAQLTKNSIQTENDAIID